MPSPTSNLSRWTFADLVDFEYMLAKDAASDRGELWKRDREIYRSHLVRRYPQPATADHPALIRSWLRQRRLQLSNEKLPGSAVSATWRLLVCAAVMTSFVFGVLHAGAVLLALDQQGHVNIAKAFLLTIGLQVFVSLLVVAAFVLRKLLVRRFGELPSMRVAFATWSLTLGTKQAGWHLSLPMDWLLAARRKYARLVAAHVGMAASVCAVAMNLGLATSLTIFHFAANDVRFGWTTTYDMGPSGAATVVRGVAAPWAGLVPAAVPTMQQIDQSWLLRERSGTTVPADASRAWAFFLLAAILIYGCVLRLVLFLIAGAMASRAMKHVDFRGPRVLDLLARMSKPRPEESHVASPAPAAPPASWWGRIWRRAARRS